MLQINKVVVNNLKESIMASGYPMQTSVDVNELSTDLDVKRAVKLGKAKSGSGHDCFLKGVNVFMVIQAPEYWWKQFERYAFQDTVSSTSTMHRIHEVDLDDVLPEETYPELRKRLEDDINLYLEFSDKEAYQRVIANLPMGYMYTRAITTNYLQLKTMYNQRKNHKLEEWQEFCRIVEALPEFKNFCITESK